MSRVAVFGCGVQKGGTTSLHAHFREHAALAAPSRKETHFFDDETMDWSAPDYGRLDAFYMPGAPGLRFDITPIYTYWPPSLARIAAYNPAARLIVLFRDPFERAWSQWCMEYARGDETLPFAEALRREGERLEAAAPLAPERRVVSYVDRGLYARQVRRALSLFPPAQLLFLPSSDLRDRHEATLARIAAFLEIAPFPPGGPKREHPQPALPLSARPTEADRAYVAERVRDDLAAFATLTGIDIAAWPSAR